MCSLFRALRCGVYTSSNLDSRFEALHLEFLLQSFYPTSESTYHVNSRCVIAGILKISM